MDKKDNNKPAVVRCTQCANGILPIDNYLMRCRHSPYMVHTGNRVCSKYTPGNPQPT